ncbi:hypothetical protein H826_YJM1463L05189 [Saccharomyces cerevisiae YJM1463]|nr:hypothetical protein H826_YJM1463L05189 [Saccharomyces cerevisiae YJM1463]
MRNGEILCCHCFYNKGDHEDDEGGRSIESLCAVNLAEGLNPRTNGPGKDSFSFSTSGSKPSSSLSFPVTTSMVSSTSSYSSFLFLLVVNHLFSGRLRCGSPEFIIRSFTITLGPLNHNISPFVFFHGNISSLPDLLVWLCRSVRCKTSTFLVIEIGKTNEEAASIIILPKLPLDACDVKSSIIVGIL